LTDTRYNADRIPAHRLGRSRSLRLGRLRAICVDPPVSV